MFFFLEVSWLDTAPGEQSLRRAPAFIITKFDFETRLPSLDGVFLFFAVTWAKCRLFYAALLSQIIDSRVI